MELFKNMFGTKKKKKGSKKRKSSSKTGTKPSQAVLDRCKKYHIKTTTRSGDKRVYRPEILLRKLIKRRKKQLAKKK